MRTMTTAPPEALIELSVNHVGPKPFIANFLEKPGIQRVGQESPSATATQINSTGGNDVLDYDCSD